MLRDVQNQYGSNLPTPFFLDFEKPHGFLAYALLNHKAFGNLFCNSQKSFHTSPGRYDSNIRGYRSFFKLNNGIYKTFYV